MEIATVLLWCRICTACDSNLLGFIIKPESGADGVKLNDHYLPLAIFGYFPAKVTMEAGVIHRGDPITSSSKAGYGMKAPGGCKIIGYALEDANAEGTIQVFADIGENAATDVAAFRRRNGTTQTRKCRTQRPTHRTGAGIAHCAPEHHKCECRDTLSIMPNPNYIY